MNRPTIGIPTSRVEKPAVAPPRPMDVASIPAEDVPKWVTIGVLVLILLYCFLNSLGEVAWTWDLPQYKFGMLVPLFALVLLWLRRQSFQEIPEWQRWVGVAIIFAGVGMRLYGAHNLYFTMDRMAFIPCLLGIFVLVGGLPVITWAGPPILFLAFMYPMPGFVEDRVIQPLKLIATQFSCYGLQTLGVDSFREGNTIHLKSLSDESITMGVVDQCSGLVCVSVFLSMGVFMALLSTHREWWERIAMVVSALPIALAANIFRITSTGWLFFLFGERPIIKTVAHDFAGNVIMMPVAIGLLFLTYHILSRIMIEDDKGIVPVGIPRTVPSRV